MQDSTPDDEQRITLTTGVRVELCRAVSAWDSIITVARAAPHLLPWMLSLAREGRIPQEQFEELWDAFLVRKDGQLRPEIHEVLLASCLSVRNDLVTSCTLSSPFRPATPEEAQALQSRIETRQDNFARWVANGLPTGGSSSGGMGR